MARQPVPTPDATTGDEPVGQEVVYQAQLMKALYDSPKTREGVLKLVKELNPAVRIPEIDTANQVRAAIEPELKAAREEREAAAKDRAQMAYDRQSDELVRDGLVTREQLGEVEKVMKDKGIADRRTAAEHFSLMNRVATPRIATSTAFQLPNPKGLWQNPAKWGREEADRVLKELGR